ncbi:pectate lyase [Pedobacter sp. MC2016-15]|uniref:pectate lyase n=1 Tax=Pedobacter sp. MC2016-15 TaxID=2994473 RepID=UPI002245100E|nr:pectate lyase [Pedobacter sp. MC2016-15]MCX2479853.1 pectate lyase [Pedobacter sp. MC2016-15]
MMRRLLSIVFLLLSLSSAYAKDIQITVAKDGSGDYSTVQEAINAVEDFKRSVTKIIIRKGIYKEKLILPASKQNVRFVGERAENTILTYDDYASKKNSEGKAPGTTGSSSFFIYGNGFSAENITFENSSGPVGQAVALWVAGDQCSFVNCRMLGFQDTLYTYGPGSRQYYKDCYIEGTVDFIFGSATVVFEGCEIFCKKGGYITAASTPSTSKYGYIFRNCKITGTAAANTFHLGRPWRPDAKVVFIKCELGEMIRPEGWSNWGKQSNEKTAYYAEYKSKGPGAQPEQRVSWSHQLDDAAAREYSLNTVFRGWKPGTISTVQALDPVAENIITYQRSVGGWPKAVINIPVDYKTTLSPADKLAIRADSLHDDATIDNSATTREIRHLVKAYKGTRNQQYLRAAEKGIDYLLKAQYANGGWPQYFPKKDFYRHQITYNDNAMINVLDIMQDIVEASNDFDVVNSAYIKPAGDAVQKGIDCILKTQIRTNGRLSAWCAQYDEKTLAPAKARSFELASISGGESVNIVLFLMRFKNPSEEMKTAVNAAVQWFDQVKIEGYEFVFIDDPSKPNGKDRVFRKNPASTIWARFYDIQTNQPFFTGRDSQPKKTVAEIGAERSAGYAWYGTWPAKLLNTAYPEWVKNNSGQ